MARVLVLTRDLLFGSQVQGALAAAGHEVELIADEPRLRERLADASSDAGRGVAVLGVDLTDGELDAAATVQALFDDGLLGRVRTLGFYSHVEPAARERAQSAGVELVVPRSRMAREGPELVAGLL
jgi:NAD(P)-dependent dehydrogenase (short-subunit alcohol dehydrogenase family)